MDHSTLSSTDRTFLESDVESIGAGQVFSNKEMKKAKKQKKKKTKNQNDLGVNSVKDDTPTDSPSNSGDNANPFSEFNDTTTIPEGSVVTTKIAVANAPIDANSVAIVPDRGFDGAMKRILSNRSSNTGSKTGSNSVSKAERSVQFSDHETSVPFSDSDPTARFHNNSDLFRDEAESLRRSEESRVSYVRADSCLQNFFNEDEDEMARQPSEFTSARSMKSYEHSKQFRDRSEKTPTYNYRNDPSFYNMRRSQQFSVMTNMGEVETYPADCYSFIAVHSPLEGPFYFFFGLMVFCFQIAFLIYMILNKMNSELGLNGEVDNPADDWFAKFIPSNITNLVRATQITAVLSYVVFADSSLKDCVSAVELFPRLDRSKRGDKVWLVVFSCFLRFTQGLLAILATFLMIVTDDDVIDIILNFAAVNFISTLDECAFELAKWGKYGPSLEMEAKRIEEMPIPYCLHRKYHHLRYIFTVIPISIVLIACVITIGYYQETDSQWVTQILRVQFQESTGLQLYSGCYEVSEYAHNKRKNYDSFIGNPLNGTFGYCKDKRQWILFKDKGDGEDEGGPTNDPCMVTRENELAHSATTDYFDIYTSTEDPWFTASGTPLDMYFFDTDKRGVDLADNCGSFLSNGKCDSSFNTLGYQYDGGDCCASTCRQTNCGQSAGKGAFGSDKIPAIGYSDCLDPIMESVTIKLNRITSSRDRKILNVTDDQIDEYFREKEIDFWEEDPVTPFLVVDCDGDNVLSLYIEDFMENETETIQVGDGARCKVGVSNTTNFQKKWDNDPIWWVDYSIYHGNDTTNHMIDGYSGEVGEINFHRIPECYFDKLDGIIELFTAYSRDKDSNLALDWLINDASGNSRCDDDFLIERFALAAINFAAPIVTESDDALSDLDVVTASAEKFLATNVDESYLNTVLFNTDALWVSNQQQCRWENIACEEGSVETLAVRSKDLKGTISTSVGLLTGLRRFDYDANGLTSTIPSEIGKLTELAGLDIDNNELTGTIPTEFGRLVNMRELDLDKNKLTGTIPTEFGRMAEAREFDLIHNQLSGPIPTELGELFNMKTLSFHNNQLSGTIPTEIGLMKKLEDLHLNVNKISGTIPTELGDARTMKNLWLANNVMLGTMPSRLGRLGKLITLDLENNDFDGTLPTEIGLMTSLEYINLRGNSFKGRLPSEIGSLTNLRELRLENNNFEGTIPIEVLFLQRLRIITFDDNLRGEIPKDIKTLVPCVLCDGEPYDAKRSSKIYYENGEYGIDEFNCTVLMQQKEDPDLLLSSNACDFLQNNCAQCDVRSGDFQDLITAGDINV
jgi:hypothetical protein